MLDTDKKHTELQLLSNRKTLGILIWVGPLMENEYIIAALSKQGVGPCDLGEGSDDVGLREEGKESGQIKCPILSIYKKSPRARLNTK